MTAALIETAQGFYAQLAQNNSRNWWTTNRAPYDEVLKPQALTLSDDLTPYASDLLDCLIKPKLFRPHRDVRFSKDKTPYKTHLHMMWQAQDPDATQSPVFFFGIGLDYVSVGAGIMGFDKGGGLPDWRTMLDLDTNRIAQIMDQLNALGYHFRETALKRVPSPYPADHKMAHSMRMKGCVANRDIGTPDKLPQTIKRCFEGRTPLNKLLIQIAS